MAHRQISPKTFVPRSVNLFNIHGKLTSKHLRATTLAEYLSQKVWKAPDRQHEIPVAAPATTDCSSPFWQNSRLFSAPLVLVGPLALIPRRYAQGLPLYIKSILLDHFNHCFSTITVPDSWALSEVVMLVKKFSMILGIFPTTVLFLSKTLCVKYMLLFFRNVLHIILMTNFTLLNLDFAPNAPTNQPIHIMRRIFEVYERQQNALRVFKTGLRLLILSFSLPLSHPSWLSALSARYRSPKFRVRDSGHFSETRCQTRGLRQGCPSSPYLFNFVLAHLFHDVETSYISQYGLHG